jgi:hypothetical protein
MDFPLERVVSNRLEAITGSDLDPLNARACGRSQSRLQGSSRYFCASNCPQQSLRSPSQLRCSADVRGGASPYGESAGNSERRAASLSIRRSSWLRKRFRQRGQLPKMPSRH